MTQDSTKQTPAVPYFRMALEEGEILAVTNVLRSGWLTTGPQVTAFETEFALKIGENVEAIAVNSNTAGLHLCVEALGIGPGDEVIVPNMTFTATAEIVRYVGADPVFVDVCPNTLCIDTHKLEKAISARTKAIIPVHFGGVAADLDAIQEIAKHYDLAIIEDAAHSFPATYNGKAIGAHGTTASVFSFYANKTITTGEGGMIVTSNKDLARRCRIMRLHGIDRDIHSRFTDNKSSWHYDVIAPGFKYNMTDVAAALGRAQLQRAEKLRRLRQSISNKYDAAFADIPLDTIPSSENGGESAYHLYVIRLQNNVEAKREDLEQGLKEQNIGYSVHYTPLHMLSYWQKKYHLKDAQFPVSTSHYARSLSLPIFPSMHQEEIDRVISAVRETVLSFLPK